MRLALALVAVAVLAPACGGRTSDLTRADLKVEAVARAVPTAGPVLHGDFVAWGEGGESEGAETTALSVVRAAPGVPRRIIFRQPATEQARAWWLEDFQGSSQLVSFVRRWKECNATSDDPNGVMCSGNHSDAVAIEADGTTHVVTPSGQCNAPREIDAFAADGPTIAWVGTRCSDGTTERALWVSSVGGGSPRLLESGSMHLDIMLAGPFLARSRGGIGGPMNVVDLRSGKVLYESRTTPGAADAIQSDLAADGSVVVASQPSGRVFRDVVKYSAYDPGGHRLDLKIRFDFEAPNRKMLQAADRLIAFERPARGNGTALVVADDSGASRVIARFDGKTQRVGEFDFDGHQLTWAAREVARFQRECRPTSYGHPECRSVPIGPIVIYRARLGR